jgi:hypothetical protein
MVQVRLDEMASPMIIVSASTGVIYTHQVGGTSLVYEELEDFAVPVRLDEREQVASFEDRLSYHTMEIAEIPAETLDRIDLLFKSYPDLVGIACDRSRVSREAWIWISIDERCAQLDGLRGRHLGVLTWQNSD